MSFLRLGGRFDIINSMIHESDTIGIAGHVLPDHDSFASCLAMYSVLKHNFPEKRISVYLDYTDMFPDYFEITGLNTPSDTVDFFGMDDKSLTVTAEPISSIVDRTDTTVDMFIGVDTGLKSRIDERLWGIIDSAYNVAYFDHHYGTEYSKRVSLACDPSAPSATTLLYRFFKCCDYVIPPKAYTALYIGLVGDTGNFMYSNTTEDTLALAYNFGCKMDKQPYYVSQKLFHSRSKKELEVYAYIIDNVWFLEPENNKIVVFRYDKLDDFSTYFNTTVKPVEVLTTLDRYGVAISLIKKDDGNYRVSMRSSGPVNVELVARDFGGGGHHQAAGCTIKPDRIDELYSSVISAVNGRDDVYSDSFIRNDC